MGRKIPRILSIGAATQDVFLHNSRDIKTVQENNHDLVTLEMGSKIDINKIDFATGGGATNAAVTFARAGLMTSFMGVIGSDPAGQQVLKELDTEFVDTSRVEISENYNTDYSTVILAPNGERTILTYRGASSRIFANNFKLRPREFDWIYVSNLSGRFDTLDNIFHEATKNGVKIMWNPGKKELVHPEMILNLLNDVEALLLNKEEAQSLFGDFEPEELVLRAKNLVKIIIVTSGADGVWATDGDCIVRAGMYEDVPRKDTTGAGDAFGSGFLSQWSQGAGIKQSILYASANSTSVIQHIGAKKGILRKGEELHSMPMYEKRLNV